MAFGVVICVLAVLRLHGGAYAEEGYSKEAPSVPFNEGSVPSPTPVTIVEGTPTAAPPANPTPTPIAPLATPGWHNPFSLLGAYPAAPIDVAGRYLGGYPGVTPHSYSGHFLGGYPAVSQDYANRWYGPVAIPVVLSDGTLANTPEVAAARAQHLAALNRAKALWFGKYNDGSYNPLQYGDRPYPGYPGYAPSAPGYAPSAPGYAPAPGYVYGAPGTAPFALGPSTAPWTGPLASPTVLPSGYLADTPDIGAARAAHLAALSRSYEEAALWRSKALAKGWK